MREPVLRVPNHGDTLRKVSKNTIFLLSSVLCGPPAGHSLAKSGHRKTRPGAGPNRPFIFLRRRKLSGRGSRCRHLNPPTRPPRRSQGSSGPVRSEKNSEKRLRFRSPSCHESWGTSQRSVCYQTLTIPCLGPGSCLGPGQPPVMWRPVSSQLTFMIHAGESVIFRDGHFYLDTK